jgi:adenylyltransferase/sulfurtransferase
MNLKQNMKEVTVEELHQWLQDGKALRFLDVRQPGEWPEAEGIIDLQIPLPLVEKEFGQIDRNADVIVYCKSGDRSQKAIEILSEKFEFNNLIKLKGGVEEWINFRESLM